MATLLKWPFHLTCMQLSIHAVLPSYTASAPDLAPFATVAAHSDICTVTIFPATLGFKTYMAPCLYLQRAKLIKIKCGRYVFLPGPWDTSRQALTKIVADLSRAGVGYRVWETTLLGTRIVFASDNPHQVAAYLVAVGAYRAQRITHDGGYEVSLPSGEKMRQGADGIDAWIRNNL